MSITVAPVDASLRDAVLGLRLEHAQRAWVGSIGAMLAVADASPSAESMAILAGGVVVGCYRLEYRLQTITTHSFAQPGVALLGYCIDARRQRRGAGTGALAIACDDVRARHPEVALVALNVACGNLAAQRLYRRAGFHALGPPHAGGPGGPEQLMALHLKPRDPADPPDHD